MRTDKDIEGIRAMSSRLLAQELKSRGISIKHLNPYTKSDAFLELSYGRHKERVYGTKSSKNSYGADAICENKYLARKYLEQGGLEVAAGEIFARDDRKNIEAFIAHVGFPCVLKKNNGSRGELVFVGIKSLARSREIVGKYFAQERFLLVEKEFSGQEYRFFATRRKVVGVASREPANVIGDGARTIRELVAAKNGSRREKFQIKFTDQIEEFLHAQKLCPESVPGKDCKVYLRNNSNLSTGGDSKDCTDSCHPDYKKLAVRAIQAIPGLVYGGVDIMVRGDISRPLSEGAYAILEVNSNPGIFIHHFPYEGKSRDVAAAIADVLFPETRKRR